MSTESIAIDTEIATVVAERKLPNDLSLVEYSEIVSALESVCHMAARANLAAPSSTYMIRARYGSDFQLVIAVPVTIATIIIGLCKGASYLAKAAKDIATARREQAAAAVDAAQARKLNAEAALLEAKAHVDDLPRTNRINELRDRVRDDHLKRAVIEYLRETDALGSRQRLTDTLRGVSTNADDVSDVEDLARSIVVLGSYDIHIVVERAPVG